MAIEKLSATFTQAQIAAIGANTVGRLSMGLELPANSLPLAMFSRNLGADATGIATLTVGVVQGSASDVPFGTAATVFAANTKGQAPLAAGVGTDDRFNFYVPWTPHAQFTGNANLSGLTGLANGVEVTLLYWQE